MDLDALEADLAGILEAVAVSVVPHTVTEDRSARIWDKAEVGIVVVLSVGERDAAQCPLPVQPGGSAQ